MQGDSSSSDQDLQNLDYKPEIQDLYEIMTRTQSINQREVAIALSYMLIDAINNDNISSKLLVLLDVIYADQNSNNEIKQQKFTEVLEGLTNGEKRELFECYQRMGELYELAGLTARDNYFFNFLKNGQMIPGGIEEFVQGKSLSLVLSSLAQPVSEITITMHPTNIQGLEPMKALRNIAKILHEKNIYQKDKFKNNLNSPKKAYGLVCAVKDESRELKELRMQKALSFCEDNWQMRLKEAVADYQNTPILHTVNGKEDNLTVRDETKIVINYLSNIYEDSVELFKSFDRVLKKWFKEEYNPLMLTINQKFGSWGSAGDKDGNDNVTSEKTLEALIRHSYEIVSHYKEDLQFQVCYLMPELDEWRAILTNVEKNLEKLLQESEKLSDDTNAMRSKNGEHNPIHYDEKFNQISVKLQEIRAILDEEKYLQQLNELVDKYKNQKQYLKSYEKLIEMVRKFKWFKFYFAKIEYRETAEEYCKVVTYFISNYNTLTPSEKVETLTNLLSKNQLPADLLEKVKEVIKAGAEKPLSDKSDDQAITYHTLKRMEIARDHSDFIKDNVLAECGALDSEKYKDPKQAIYSKPCFQNTDSIEFDKFYEIYFNNIDNIDNPKSEILERYIEIAKDMSPEDIQAIAQHRGNIKQQGVANLLEALLLQRLVVKDGKIAKMGIIPLFEDKSTMQVVDGIMTNAYNNPIYYAHLEALKDRNGNQLTQQVQIAHSDNRRRAGSFGGTAYIHEAHHRMRVIHQKNGIKLQFFEGGSMCDAYRNGVRSVSAQIDAYKLHDFAKFTYQGRDLQNYFSHPCSVKRLLMRNFCHPAEYFASNTIANQPSDYLIKINNNNDKICKIMDEIAIAALRRTFYDYVKDDFSKSAIGSLFAVIGAGYDREAKVGNRGSRAAARCPSNATSTNNIQPIDVDKLRTIPFSMVAQQNRLNLAWLSGNNLERYIDDEIQERISDIKKTMNAEEDAKEETQELKIQLSQAWKKIGDKLNIDFTDPDAVKNLTIHQWIRILYYNSNVFQDSMDKSAFAIARSDIRALKEDIMKKSQLFSIGKNAIIYENASKYTEHLERTISIIGNTVHAAFTGKMISSDDKHNPYERYNDKQRPIDEQAVMTNVLDEISAIGPEISLKNNYQDFVLFAKSQLDKEKMLDDHDLAILSAAGLTSNHSRFLMADDPKFGKSMAKQETKDLLERKLSTPQSYQTTMHYLWELRRKSREEDQIHMNPGSQIEVPLEPEPQLNMNSESQPIKKQRKESACGYE